MNALETFYDWKPLPQTKQGAINRKQTRRRRSRTELALDLLYSVDEEGTKLTHMMYRSNISWQTVKAYVKIFEDAGLLSYSNGRYYLTEKGGQAVFHYKTAKQLLGDAALPSTRYNIGE